MSAPARAGTPAAPSQTTVPCSNESSVYIHAGEWCCAGTSAMISTVLGSCVAVCLWDASRRLGGMNHFMLPGGSARADARFADPAIDALVEGMRNLGARGMVAKVFGGAEVLAYRAAQASVGRQNASAAKARLHLHAIPVIAAHLGGTSGVVVRFNTASGEVMLRQVMPPERHDV